MLSLEVQCQRLNRGAAATCKTVFKSLSRMGAEEFALVCLHWCNRIWRGTSFVLGDGRVGNGASGV